MKFLAAALVLGVLTLGLAPGVKADHYGDIDRRNPCKQVCTSHDYEYDGDTFVHVPYGSGSSVTMNWTSFIRKITGVQR